MKHVAVGPVPGSLESVYLFLVSNRTKRGFLKMARVAIYFGQEDGEAQ